MIDLSLIRISAKIIPTSTRFQVPKSFSVGSQHYMAMNIDQSQLQVKMNKKVEEKDKEEAKKKLPPPPEKPEPGDCCGSGCVRCVWDVYYEELEEYDKLCKSISDSDPDLSSSKQS
ncbi:hypothetical protein MANES_02G175500v8 [Manihot esculenta]|uniref:Oxidoreductase-like domain-containing protein n=1 Tax=Manihot esculenta TaxID=3983 RepID=A0A2C9WEW2_MANES|nr:hypothetical protein MANES_02G175500v8 [Manihot esculenta]